MAPRLRPTHDSTEPQRTFFFPNPDGGQGYALNVYESLLQHHFVVIYEIKKPDDVIPYCFIVRRFQDHEKFFHDALQTDHFDSIPDRMFLHRLWYLLCPHHGLWDPDHFDFSIAEEDEPEMVRGHGRAVLLRTMLSFTQPYQLFASDSESEDERSLTPPPMVREYVGR